MHYNLYSFNFYGKNVVLRRVIPSYALYYDVLEAKCSIDIGYLIGGLWGKPHDSWCAPLTPHCTFMFISYRMIVVGKKWLGEHLLLLVLMQARDALCQFHVWNYDPLSGCHMTACFHWFLLPCIADILMFMGSFIWRVLYELEMPIGSMIIPPLHVVCFRRNNGQTMIATSHLFSSCGRSHLKNLSSWRRHFMAYLCGGVAWTTLGV